jgi:hypothetical protein
VNFLEKSLNAMRRAPAGWIMDVHVPAINGFDDNKMIKFPMN